jgi:hypothetical protein
MSVIKGRMEDLQIGSSDIWNMEEAPLGVIRTTDSVIACFGLRKLQASVLCILRYMRVVKYAISFSCFEVIWIDRY